MTTAIVGLSRYFLAIFITFYTLHCFLVFAYSNENERNGFYITQNILMVLIHVLGFFVIAVEKNNPDLMFICFLQEVMFFSVIIIYHFLYPAASRLIVNNVCMLLAIIPSNISSYLVCSFSSKLFISFSSEAVCSKIFSHCRPLVNLFLFHYTLFE